MFTAGARRKQAPKTAFRRSRCRTMKAMIFWYDVAPASVARTENSNRWHML